MIIIEGPDHVGKTTLATKIAAKLGLQRNHLSKPEVPYDLEYFIEKARNDAVWDRYHLGTIVYGQVLGLHDNALGYSDFKCLERFFRWRRAIIVVLHAEPSLYRNHLIDTAKDEMFSVDQIVKSNLVFQGVACHTQIDRVFKVLPDFPDDKFVDDVVELWRITR